MTCLRTVAVVVLTATFGILPVLSIQALAQDASTTRIELSDGASLARQLLLAGQPDAARQIAQALLLGNPDDTQALILLAQSQLQLGNSEGARQAARRAWRSAKTQRERFSAAFTMADVLAAQESYSRSQLWLRRAIHSAPGQQSEIVATDAFRRVRQANPLAVEVSFGLNPSSNVNSGNSNETISFAFLQGPFAELQFAVPPGERPLSGLEISLQTDLRYRIAESEKSRTSLEFGIYGRTYVMSESARKSAPEVTGESLSYGQVSMGILHQWQPVDSKSLYSASLTYSHDWAAGSPYRYELDGTIGTQFTLENDAALTVSGGVRYSHNFASETEVITYSLRGGWSRELANDDTVGVIGQMAKATAQATDLAYEEATLGVSYDFGELSANNVSLGLDLMTSYTEKHRVYETSAFDPAGREDRISSLRFDVGFDNVDFYGFQPVVTFQARRTASSVDRFDTEGGQIGVNLRSSF